MLMPFVLMALVSNSPVAEAESRPRLDTESFALIVTNNRSLSTRRPNLRYADDDGAKYAELFSQYFGKDRVTLLTTFDAETKKLSPEWAKVAGPPTRASLDSEVGRLANRIEAVQRSGKRVELHLVFAGHGDLDRGQGYLELSDGRLTARDLEHKVIRKLPAERIHLILDSCNSFFMLSPRKPGGKRFVASSDSQADLLSRFPHVGAIVSTSSEAVTYEWSELQSGIFSYEVRSGLRGAADANGDGKVTYGELAAFIQVTNAPVANELYRPKVFTRPPGRDLRVPVLDAPTTAQRVLRLPSKGQRRFTVRDALGVRILDVHKEDGTAMSLVLPAGKDELGLYEEVRAEDDRPNIQYRSVPMMVSGPVDSLEQSAPQLASRGESPVFTDLFREPFGQVALAQVQSNGLSGGSVQVVAPSPTAPPPAPQADEVEVVVQPPAPAQAPEASAANGGERPAENPNGAASQMGRAAVVVTDAIGQEASTVATLRQLAANQLRTRGFTVIQDPRLGEPQEPDAETARIAREIGISRLFALGVGNLGRKTLLTLAEIHPENFTLLYQVNLAGQIEESDRLMRRLVDATLKRKAIETTQRMENISTDEAQPFRKRPGERLWALGLPFGLTSGDFEGAFGLSLSWMYESVHYRLGATALGFSSGGAGGGLLAFEGAWIPLDRGWSPYLAGGVGFMGIDRDGYGGSGAGFTAELGMEFFRLHSTRLLVGAQALLPAFSGESGSDSAWTPAFLFHTRLAF